MISPRGQPGSVSEEDLSVPKMESAYVRISSSDDSSVFISTKVRVVPKNKYLLIVTDDRAVVCSIERFGVAS